MSIEEIDNEMCSFQDDNGTKHAEKLKNDDADAENLN